MSNCKPNNTKHAMTIAKYRPQAAFTSPFNDFVNEFFGRDITQFLGADEVRKSAPAVNIVEREGEFELRVSVPGYGKDELKLNMEADMLTISAEKKTEDLKESERYTRREYVHSAFSRSFRLPETVNPDAITAEYTNGILHVRLPKAEAAKPKAREIGIN